MASSNSGSEASVLLKQAMAALETGKFSKCEKRARSALHVALGAKRIRACAGYTIVAHMLLAIQKLDPSSLPSAALTVHLCTLPLYPVHRARVKDLAKACAARVSMTPRAISKSGLVDELAVTYHPHPARASRYVCSVCRIKIVVSDPDSPGSAVTDPRVSSPCPLCIRGTFSPSS